MLTLDQEFIRQHLYSDSVISDDVKFYYAPSKYNDISLSTSTASTCKVVVPKIGSFVDFEKANTPRTPALPTGVTHNGNATAGLTHPASTSTTFNVLEQSDNDNARYLNVVLAGWCKNAAGFSVEIGDGLNGTGKIVVSETHTTITFNSGNSEAVPHDLTVTDNNYFMVGVCRNCDVIDAAIRTLYSSGSPPIGWNVGFEFGIPAAGNELLTLNDTFFAGVTGTNNTIALTGALVSMSDEVVDLEQQATKWYYGQSALGTDVTGR